jgi:hypothetical protein
MKYKIWAFKTIIFLMQFQLSRGWNWGKNVSNIKKLLNNHKKHFDFPFIYLVLPALRFLKKIAHNLFLFRFNMITPKVSLSYLKFREVLK